MANVIDPLAPPEPPAQSSFTPPAVQPKRKREPVYAVFLREESGYKLLSDTVRASNAEQAVERVIKAARTDHRDDYIVVLASQMKRVTATARTHVTTEFHRVGPSK